jgi:hypothetical protein
MASCECGCGTELKPAEYPSRSRRFISGHNQRKYQGQPAYVEEDRGYETPCWIWQRTRFRAGYGAAFDGDKQKSAHRVYYEATHGPIPSNRNLHHRCYVKACVNPAHLELASRRRHGVLEAEARSPLDWEDVRKIRRLRDELTQSQLARAFEVTQTTISKVVLNRTWVDPAYEP